MTRIAALIFAALSITWNLPAAVDRDADGLADDFEQSLLVRFAPQFMISAGECDVLPSEFQPGVGEPYPAARNGTIYGQVFPNGEFLEIHYYHLWARDCGRAGHTLDAEHVSALVNPDGTKAFYWYASAHQDTLCDASHGVQAAAIAAEEHGPRVWISAGKHASFLTENQCSQGCGSDVCRSGSPMPLTKLVNLGEPGRPLNGALWTASSTWSLSQKMRSDFTPAVQAALANSSDPVPVNNSVPSVRAVISAGGTSLDAVATARQYTDSALTTADTKTEDAVSTGFHSAESSVVRARRATIGWIRRRLN
jgi:hypothetical protein